MMRVVLITPPWFTLYSVGLANALCKSCEIHLIVHKSYETMLKSADLLNGCVKYFTVSFSMKKTVQNFWLSAFELRRLVNYIKTTDPDVLHLQEGGSLGYLSLPFLRQYPLISTIHDIQAHLGAESRFREWLREKAVSYSGTLIVHGTKLRQELIRKYQINDKNVEVLPHGEFSIYQSWRQKTVKTRPNSILFFGRIEKYKGLEFLIRAERKIAIAIPSLRIVIAGQGNLNPYLPLMEEPSRYQILNHYISEERVDELFQRAAIVVLPYIEASQSGVLPIAFAYGKPVVASAVGSIPEVVEDGVNGFLVPPENPSALATAITGLLADPELRTTMGQNAFQKTLEELSWTHIADQTMRLYSSVSSTNSKSASKVARIYDS